MIDNATAIPGTMTKVGLLNFPHFGLREMILLEKYPKRFPDTFQNACLLISYAK